MLRAPTAQERMMKVHEMLMRAVNREISWIQAADRTRGHGPPAPRWPSQHLAWRTLLGESTTLRAGPEAVPIGPPEEADR